MLISNLLDKFILKLLHYDYDYKANAKRDLKRHIMSIHEGVKFSCDQCEYKASERRSLLGLLHENQKSNS